MTSLGLYLVLIMWHCSTPTEIAGITIDLTSSVWSIGTQDAESPEFAKLTAMRDFVEAREASAQPLDDSCQLHTFSATEIPLETLRRVVNSHGMEGR